MLVLGLRLRVALFFAALALGGIGLLAAGLIAESAGIDGDVAAGAAAGGIVLLVGVVWWLFDCNVARPIEQVSQQMRSRAIVGGGGIDAGLARYLGDLSPALNAATEGLDRTHGGLLDSVTQEAARQSETAAQLTAVLAALPVGVVLTAADGRVVLYNGQAAHLGLALDRPVPPGLWGTSAPLGAGHVWLTTADTTGAGTLAYDFSLLAPPPAALLPQPLSHLAYVVFDTETTGLFPAQGDEIVQIAGRRVINLKPQGEWFKTLVKPHRPIPAAATRLHGICDTMVAEAPDMAEAGRAFHTFCDGAVLVAHNVAFDMAFLRRQQPVMGRVFDHPVMDTMALSALIWGRAQNHGIAAICDRLGIALPDYRRHSAPGDAEATAEAFCRMIGLLQHRGITTFGALQAALRDQAAKGSGA